jgi:predicted N-acetyltransferase YhbS
LIAVPDNCTQNEVGPIRYAENIAAPAVRPFSMAERGGVVRADDAPPPGYALRRVRETELDALFQLARDALNLDHFSRELLREKLFSARRPDEFHWAVHVAESAGDIAGFLQSAFRPAQARAWIGLFAVAPRHRRRGLARALHAAALAAAPAAPREIEALAIPCNYLVPGLDPRYTEALCFLESLGYRRFGDCVNLMADLTREFPIESDLQTLAHAGLTIRRAVPADRAGLDEFFAAHFGESWRFEAQLAIENDPPSLHLALRDGRVIAFSAHSTQNREWGFFGPMGTAPECRGLGVGRVLLWLCLNDLRAAGHRTAVIPWVGPISFYHRWAAARVERIFWRYRLDCATRA